MSGPVEDILIRALLPGDAEAYAAFRHAMLLESPKAFISEPGFDRLATPDMVRASLLEDGSAILGGFVGGRLASAAGLRREQRPKQRHRAWIWGVWTEPAFRGRGLGERVVRACADLARTWDGVRIVYLGAGAGQHAAIRMYNRIGFVAWGVEPACMQIDGELLDEVHMQLRLDGALRESMR